MDKFQRVAATIIDKVEHAIRDMHPEVDKIASKFEGNTLLHGEAYYTLEDDIAETLREETECHPTESEN
ncbi:MAG: hypothetical protein QXF26_02595 [Candidatus Bathyarchaeia archaeon]